MTDSSQSQKKLKIVSLEPKVTIIQQNSNDSEKPQSDNNENAVIVAPIFLNKEKVIEDIGELIDKVYEEFNQACTKKNLDWTAELELGMEFGVKFTARLSIAPKSSQ